MGDRAEHDREPDPRGESDDGRMRVLVTNDDGVDSPALPPLVRGLQSLGEVTVVAPDGERSWSGKHLSRLARIPVTTVERAGIEMVAVGGSPADAAQIGCHRGPRPDLVVSGINLGNNHGSAFLMTSGTVGAAVEGELSGHPAIALSVGITEGDFMAWHRHVRSPGAADGWQRVTDVALQVVDDILTAGLLDHCDVVSVNLPWEVTATTSRAVTRVARTRYGAVYAPLEDDDSPRRDADTSVAITSPLHADDGATADATEFWGPTFTKLEFLDDDLDDTDIGAAHRGQVSITPVMLPHGARVPDDVARAVVGDAE